LLKDPEAFHKKYILREKDDEIRNVSAFRFGSYMHSMILEPHLLDVEYKIFRGGTRVKKAYKEMVADNPGLEIMTESEENQAHSLMKVYNERSEAVDLIKGGEAEATLCVNLDGVDIKVRADYVNVEKGYIADVKTTADETNVWEFKKTIKKYDYLLSAALYCQAFERHYGKPFDFYFIVLGKFTKTCDVFKIGKDSMERGVDRVNNALALYKQCKESNNWVREMSLEPYDIKEV
jgi:hypothetical protein